MKFEHLVQVNDPQQPLLRPLTREQLWQGLMLRAEQPQLFMSHLQDMRIVARGDSVLARELDFGAFKVRDRIRLEPLQRMIIETEATDTHGVGLLVMTIEEPQAGTLLLRFAYQLERVTRDDPGQEALYDRFVRSAYLEADTDCVARIRQHLVAD
jgi:hypothetical protein